MSRSPVSSSARPARLGLALGVGAEQVVGLEVVAGRDRPAEGLEEVARVGELGASSSGIAASRSAW